MSDVEASKPSGAEFAKTRELRRHLADSLIRNDLPLRDGDIVIATWGKAGTTWTQQIVSQLLFDGAEGIYLGRDGRGAVWSYHNHFFTLKPERLAAINDAPDRVGPALERPPEAIRDYYRAWFDRDGHPFWPFWDHVRGWWAVRDLPNVKLLHFNDLKTDLPGAIRAIAAFLDIPIDAARFPAILEHCSFAYMKAHGSLVAPGGGVGWAGGGATFMNKGENGRWRDVLTSEDCAEYDARAVDELGPDAAAWLASGQEATGRGPDETTR